jgi:membrane-bound lytic murein transglycosylase B
MIPRRLLLAAIPAALVPPALPPPALAAPEDFRSFLASIRTEARRDGISSATLARAFAGVQPNAKVLERINHQPEFTMTWAQYRAMLLTDKRIAEGRAAWRENQYLFERVRQVYGVGPGVILGIWGLESEFGTKTGDYRVIDALATLAWGTSRRRFFGSELIAALKILDHGDVAPARMTGSYAGAMGQPQFMPTSYLRYAVDFQGDGRRNIWTSTPDVLASIANYLARSGWREGERWGRQVLAPASIDPAFAGRDNPRPLSDWARLGIRNLSGRLVAGTQPAALLLPDGPGGEAFLIYGDFAAIRRYNPSDFYALVVGLLGDKILA